MIGTYPVIGIGLDPNHHRTLAAMLATHKRVVYLLIIDEYIPTGEAFAAAEKQRKEEAARMQECMAALAASVATIRYCPEEELLPEPHINGDLKYLYRPPKLIKNLPIRKNHRRIIRQPCWRAGRWKSLT